MSPGQRGAWFRTKVKAMIRDRALSAEARFLWLLIESYASKDGTSCFPSVETLMLESRKCKKWVEKYLRELKNAGRLRVIGKKATSRGAVNVYEIRYPLTYHYGSQNDPNTMGNKMTHGYGSQNDPQPEFSGPDTSLIPPPNVITFDKQSAAL